MTVLHPKERGVLTEAKVLHHLLDLGYTVSQPYGDNARYDYIVDTDKQLLRVQVKTAHDKENGAFAFNTVSHRPHKDSKVETDPYDGQIDGFIVYSPDYDEFCWVDIEEAARQVMTIRSEPTSNGQTSGINWVEDYSLNNL